MNPKVPLPPLVVDAARVMPFGSPDAYESRMLLDHVITGRDNAIQINHGTVAPGYALSGATHGDDEIYYILSGRGQCRLGEKTLEVHPGQVIFIPAGCLHALDNRAGEAPLCVLTLWRDWRMNDAYAERLEAWGTSFRLMDE